MSTTISSDVWGSKILPFLSNYPKYKGVSKEIKTYYKPAKDINYIHKEYPYFDKSYDLSVYLYYLNKAAIKDQWDDFLVLTKRKVDMKMGKNKSINDIDSSIIKLPILVAHSFRRADIVKYLIDKYDPPYYTVQQHKDQNIIVIEPYLLDMLLMAYHLDMPLYMDRARDNINYIKKDMSLYFLYKSENAKKSGCTSEKLEKLLGNPNKSYTHIDITGVTINLPYSSRKSLVDYYIENTKKDQINNIFIQSHVPISPVINKNMLGKFALLVKNGYVDQLIMSMFTNPIILKLYNNKITFIDILGIKTDAQKLALGQLKP